MIFLGAVVLSAVKGGLAPSVVSIALSALLLRAFFVGAPDSLLFGKDWEGMERMGGFILLALLLSCFVAGLRQERNDLRDNEERYRLLAENASDAIVVIDERSEILYLNPAAEHLFGRQAAELRGQSLAVLLPGDLYQAQLTELRQRLDTRKAPIAVQLPGLHQSGERLLVEMTLGSSCQQGRSVFTAIIRDLAGRGR
jgi:PAS domain S-box-containing protein